MSDKLDIAPYDSADYLTSAEDIENYLEAMQEEIAEYPDHGPKLMLHALGVVARAKSRMALSKEAGLSRQGVYKALAPNARPSLQTVFKLAHALGLEVKLSAKS